MIYFIKFFLLIFKLFRSSSDETTPTISEQLNVSEIRKRFENQSKSELPQKNLHKHRPSVPTIQSPMSPTFQTNNSAFSYLSTQSSNTSQIL